MKVTQEQVETFTALIDELKGIRRVRTPAGRDRFGQEIGTVIISDVPFVSTALLSHPAITNLPPALGEAPLPDGFVRMYHMTPMENLSNVLENGLRVDRAQNREGVLGVWVSDSPYFSDRTGRATIEVAIPQELRDSIGEIDAIDYDISPEQFLTVNEEWHDRVRQFVQDERIMDALANGDYDDVLENEDEAVRNDPTVVAVRYIRDNVFEVEENTKTIQANVGFDSLNQTSADAVREAGTARGLTIEAVEMELERRIDLAKDMPDPYRDGFNAYDGGISWYLDEGYSFAEKVGRGDVSLGAGVIAAVSAQNPWPANKRSAAMIFDMVSKKDELKLDTPALAWAYYRENQTNCGPVGEYDFNVAWKIANGASVEENLTGRKRRNFYNNIIGSTDSITVDTHMMKTLVYIEGSLVTNKTEALSYIGQSWDTTKSSAKRGEEPKVVDGAGYTYIAQAVLNVAAKTGLEPRQIQAIVWNTAVKQRWPKPNKGGVTNV